MQRTPTIIDVTGEKQIRNSRTPDDIFDEITEIENRRDTLVKQFNSEIETLKYDREIAQIIHLAILDTIELATCSRQMTISDLVPDARDNLIFMLARKLKRANEELDVKRRALKKAHETVLDAAHIITQTYLYIPNDAHRNDYGNSD